MKHQLTDLHTTSTCILTFIHLYCVCNIYPQQPEGTIMVLSSTNVTMSALLFMIIGICFFYLAFELWLLRRKESARKKQRNVDTINAQADFDSLPTFTPSRSALSELEQLHESEAAKGFPLLFEEFNAFSDRRTADRRKASRRPSDANSNLLIPNKDANLAAIALFEKYNPSKRNYTQP
jgi:hypothetical protein